MWIPLKFIFVCLLVLLVLLGACSPIRSSSYDPPLLNTGQPQETPSENPGGNIQPLLPAQGKVIEIYPTLPTPFDPVIQNLIDLAKNDLSGRLSIQPDQINSLEVSQVTWSDAGLGCQQSGSYSAQVLTPGYRILLEYAQKTYEYHTNNGTKVIYCELPQLPISGTPSQ